MLPFTITYITFPEYWETRVDLINHSRLIDRNEYGWERGYIRSETVMNSLAQIEAKTEQIRRL